MLKQTGNNSVSSDSGFAIRGIRFSELHYAEGDKNLTVDIEMQLGEPSMVVYESSITKWEPPHDNEALSTEKRDEILQNISEALKFLKISFEIG